MYDEQELRSLIASLHNSLKLQAAMMAKFEQSEASMQAKVNQHMRALQDALSYSSSHAKTIVENASTIIFDDAMKTLAPIATGFGHDVSARLQTVHRALSIWCGVAVATLLLVLLSGWMTLAHYRQELVAVRGQLQRHEDAIPVLQAYAASDAILCGGVICVNIDTESQRLGDRRQYRPARPRPMR